MKVIKLLLLLCLVFASCKTIDIDKSIFDNSVDSDSGASISDIISSVIIEPEVIVIEKQQTIFVPQAEAAPSMPAAGQNTVRESNKEGILLPQDYSHAAVVYDYNADVVYEVFCQPLRVTDICLEPGEIAVEAPFISDSERWILGGGISYENGANVQHIYVKPASTGLSASLIVNTSRRVYRLIIRSYSDVFMPMVRWRYFSALPQINLPSNVSSNAEHDGALDPRFLSFNYRITHSFFKKPYWLPDLVFDDGSKTYIRFPEQVLQRELPAVFENRKFVLNYRVMGNLVIIDKLIEDITVKIETTEITIKKKRG